MTRLPATQLEVDDEAPKRPGFPVDPGRLWLAIKRGWPLIPLLTAIGAAVGVTYALVKVEPVYKSESVMIYEPGQGDVTTRDLSTQAGVLKLPGTIGQVKQQLDLKTPVKVLTEQVTVWYDANSNLVTVEGEGSSAEDAQQLASTLVDVFLEHQKELARTRARETLKTLEDDLAAARQKAKRAREKYDTFRNEHDVVDPEVEARLALESIAELQAARERAQAEASALEARANELGQLVRRQPRTRVQSSSRANPAATRLAELRSKLSEASARLAPDHPTIVSLKAQIASLEKEAADPTHVVSAAVVAPNPEFDTMRSTLSTTQAERAAVEKREKSYDDIMESAQKRVSKLSAIEGKAAELKSEVDLAQQRIEQLEMQLTRAQEAVRAPEVRFRLLTPAVKPKHPEASPRRKIAAASTLLGFMLAVGLLVAVPLRNGRLYTAREVAYWARVPVLASSTWPSHNAGFLSLIDELNDHALFARGTTLIIGASSREMRLAAELSDWLGPTPRRKVSKPPSAPAATAATGDGTKGGPTVEHEVSVPDTTALARVDPQAPAFFAWAGGPDGHAVRRAARMADRVVVLVGSGWNFVTHLSSLSTRLGRESGVGAVLVDVPEELLTLPDRIGDVESFWHSRDFPAENP